MKTNFILIFSMLFSFVSISQNKIETDAKISDVIIYTSSAEMHYKKTLNLKKGKNTIVFTNLTPFIVDNSINVGVSDKTVKIITVTDKINYLKSQIKRDVNVYKDSIETNLDKVGFLQTKIEVIEKEKILLFSGNAFDGVVADGILVSEIEKASEFINKRYTKLNTDLYNLKKEQDELNKINVRLNYQIEEMSVSKVKTVSEITVVLYSPKSNKVVVDFKMLTPNAGWAPLYDLKYNGPDKKLDFVFRANVFNASNVDWNEVKVKLSTASPTVGFSLPSLQDAQKMKSNQNIQYQSQSIKFREVQANNVLTEYKIAYNYTIPSDGKPYLVDVSETSFASEYSYTLIPKIDKNGFLMANIPNWNEQNYLSGTVNIYNNGTFLGKTYLNTITENDTLSVYLGKDKKIEAIRKEKSKEHTNKIVGNTVTDKTIVDFTIKNNYNKTVDIMLIDQAPVFAERDKIKITVSNIDNAEYDKDDGSIIWKFTLNPNENKTMDFGYVLKAPKEYSELVRQKRKKFRAIQCPSF